MSEIAQETPSTEETGTPKGGFGPGSIVLMVLIVVVAMIIGLAVLRQSQGRPMEGRAPAFSFTTFDGVTYQLEDFRGKVVVLNFWASWCVPCAAEAPEFQSAWEQYEDQDVMFLGIAYADSEQNSLTFLERFGISYLNAPDTDAVIHDLYHVGSLPETFIIDQNGDMARWFIAEVNEAQLSAVIDQLLLRGALGS